MTDLEDRRGAQQPLLDSEGQMSSPDATLAAPGESDALLGEAREAPESNTLRCTVILAKTIIGAGVAALPLTDALLGWPLALVFLLLVAYATFESLVILVRAIDATACGSYSDVAKEMLGFWPSILLEIAIVAFAVGLMIVYEVAVGDILVGKTGFGGLLCSHRHGALCSRPLVVGLVTAVGLLPSVSFRKLESSATASWIGMLALCVWALGTLILLAASIFSHTVQRVRFTPDKQRLGGSSIAILANVCAIIPVLTTAYSCQAAAPFVMAELRPKTMKRMRGVAVGAVATTTGLYVLIALGSYLVFGGTVQSDVLHNYTPQSLEAVVPRWLAEVLCITVRLSFLLGVTTLFPLMNSTEEDPVIMPRGSVAKRPMIAKPDVSCASCRPPMLHHGCNISFIEMFPARDGLVRLLSRRTEPLSTVPFYIVTYGLTVAVYLVSVVTPSIWGPIQIIGATAGAVIGFLIPGLLAFRRIEGLLASDEDGLQNHGPGIKASWKLTSPIGWMLVAMAIIQCITGVATQLLTAN